MRSTTFRIGSPSAIGWRLHRSCPVPGRCPVRPHDASQAWWGVSRPHPDRVRWRSQTPTGRTKPTCRSGNGFPWPVKAGRAGGARSTVCARVKTPGPAAARTAQSCPAGPSPGTGPQRLVRRSAEGPDHTGADLWWGRGDGGSSHSCHLPSAVASGCDSPVSAARAVATSVRVARTYVDVAVPVSPPPSVWPA